MVPVSDKTAVVVVTAVVRDSVMEKSVHSRLAEHFFLASAGPKIRLIMPD